LKRQEELEEQGFLHMEVLGKLVVNILIKVALIPVSLKLIDRLKEERGMGGYIDTTTFTYPTFSTAADDLDTMSSSQITGDDYGEDGDVLGPLSHASNKTLASVSSLLALKRERIEQQRRATIMASTKVASGSSQSDLVAHSMRTLHVIQHKSRTSMINMNNGNGNNGQN
jgi:hypothetical protein